MRWTAGGIADRLATEVRGVCRHLLPNGKEKSGEWVCGDVHGSEGGSLKVCLKGVKAGRWADFSNQDQHHGDLLDLWCAVRGIGLQDAFREASEYLGIQMPNLEVRSRNKPQIERPKCRKSSPQTEVGKWLRDTRKFSEEAIEAYRVAEDGEMVVFPFLSPAGDLEMVKSRAWHDKHKCRTKADGGNPLFGWQAVPDTDRSVVICEGEPDALAWFTYGFPSLSVPNGASSITWIDWEFDRLSQFDVIYLSFDMDQAGQKLVPEIVERLGRDRCRVVSLPRKDCNECLMAGDPCEVIAAAVGNAKTQDPDELRAASDFTDAIIKEFYPDGDEPCWFLPWSKAKDSFVFRPAEITILGGVNGHGKSEMVGNLTLSVMEQGAKACVASMEFKVPRWLKKLTRQAACIDKPSEPYIRQISDGWYRDRLWAFTTSGTAKAERVVEIFEYAARRYGVRWFVVDNLAKCGLGEDDYNGQKALIDKLGDFSRDFDAHVVVCAHMKKREDEGKASGKMDIKGTGAITDMADNVLIIWRNKPKEEKRQKHEAAISMGAPEVPFEDERKPDAFLRVHKARNGEEEPNFSLWFDFRSHQFVSGYGATPHRYVRFEREEMVA